MDGRMEQGYKIYHFGNVLTYMSTIFKYGGRQYKRHKIYKNDVTLSSNVDDIG